MCEVFDAWDLDQSGHISLLELHRILRRGGAVKLPPSLKPDPITQDEIEEANRTTLQSRRPLHAFGNTVRHGPSSSNRPEPVAAAGKPAVVSFRTPEYYLVDAPAEEQKREDPKIAAADRESRLQRARSRGLFERAILARKPKGGKEGSPSKHSPAKSAGSPLAINKKGRRGKLVRAFAFAEAATSPDEGAVVRLRLKAITNAAPFSQVAKFAKHGSGAVGSDLIEVLSLKCGRDGIM